MRIQHLIQIKANLLEQKEKINANKILMKERTELNKHQSITSEVMNCLVKVSEAMKENKLVEK